MEDPELYTQRKPAMLSPGPKGENPHATKTSSRFKNEQGMPETTGMSHGYGTHMIHTASEPEKTQPFVKKLSGSLQTSDDLHLRTDPTRVYFKPDIIRVNSSNNLVAAEAQAMKQIEELEQPPERSYKKRPSLVHRQLTVNKTKEESKLLIC